MGTFKLKLIFWIIFNVLYSFASNAQFNYLNNKSFNAYKSDLNNYLSSGDLRLFNNYPESIRKAFVKDTSFKMQRVFLTEDDPAYNKRYPLILPVAGIFVDNFLTLSFDRYLLNASYSHISLTTWKNNLKYGWVWDNDRFAMNFYFHPMGGGYFYNCGRSSGYNFYESTIFAAGGSLMWEYFGENTSPSLDDIINTTGNSMIFGEALYRLSSYILDDRTTGVERVFREIFAGLINPARGLNRLIQGKSFRITAKEVSQKEPVRLKLYAGEHLLNKGTEFFGGRSSQIFGVDINYGDPFTDRPRKPFDVFNVNAELGNGDSRKILNILNGYGLLFGKNISSGKMDMLIGAFQNYNFFDNRLYELYSMSFGGGAITRIKFPRNMDLYTNCYIGLVPFGGNSTEKGPQMTQFIDYNFTGGMEAMMEGRLNIYDHVNVEFKGYYYWIHTYVGTPGNNYLGLLKPSFSVKLFNNLNAGFEHVLYISDRFNSWGETFRVRNSEQKIFLQLNFSMCV
jgi:hypothetical protein